MGISKLKYILPQVDIRTSVLDVVTNISQLTIPVQALTSVNFLFYFIPKLV